MPPKCVALTDCSVAERIQVGLPQGQMRPRPGAGGDRKRSDGRGDVLKSISSGGISSQPPPSDGVRATDHRSEYSEHGAALAVIVKDFVSQKLGATPPPHSWAQGPRCPVIGSCLVTPGQEEQAGWGLQFPFREVRVAGWHAILLGLASAEKGLWGCRSLSTEGPVSLLALSGGMGSTRPLAVTILGQ